MQWIMNVGDFCYFISVSTGVSDILSYVICETVKRITQRKILLLLLKVLFKVQKLIKEI
jgi:hypothetical protein